MEGDWYDDQDSNYDDQDSNYNDQDSVSDSVQGRVVQDEVQGYELHRVASHEVQTEPVRPKSNKRLQFGEPQVQYVYGDQETNAKQPLVGGITSNVRMECGYQRGGAYGLDSLHGNYGGQGPDYSMGCRPLAGGCRLTNVNVESHSPTRRGYDPMAYVNSEPELQCGRGYERTTGLPNVDQNWTFPPRVNNSLGYDVLNHMDRYNPPGRAKPCPSYDGKSSFKDFLIQFEMISEYNQWSMHARASELAMCLKDQAVAVLADLAPSQRRHYDSLVAALMERFEPDNQSQLHRAQLKSRIRRDNEPLPQLAHDIRRLVRDSNPGVPMDIRESMAKDSFLDALNDKELELAIFQSRPKTLQDALRTAIEIEAFHRSRDRRLPLRTLKESKCTNDTKTSVQELQATIARLEEELKLTKLSQGDDVKTDHSSSVKSSYRSKHKVVCYYCDKPGHVVKDCRKKLADKRNKEVRDPLNK